MRQVPGICEERGLCPLQVFVMGRSLGSVWAAELGQAYGAKGDSQPGSFAVDGLIIESGFSGLKTLPIARPLMQVVSVLCSHLLLELRVCCAPDAGSTS